MPATKNQIVAYAVLTAVVGVVPAFMSLASLGYGIVAAALGAIFIAAFPSPSGVCRMAM